MNLLVKPGSAGPPELPAADAGAPASDRISSGHRKKIRAQGKPSMFGL